MPEVGSVRNVLLYLALAVALFVPAGCADGPPRAAGTVATEITVLAVPADGFADWFVETLGRAAPEEDLPAPTFALSAAEARRVLTSGARVAGERTVDARPGEESEFAVVEQTAYIADYEVTRTEDGAVIADPVIGTFQTGVTGKLCTERRTDGTLARRIEITVAEKQETQIITVKLGGGQEVEIELPEIQLKRVRAEWTAAADSATLVVAPAMPKERLLLLVRGR